jgi:signal transduction histidine kinase
MSRKALTSFITGILLLVGAIILDRSTLRKVEEHSRLVEQTYDVIARLGQLSNHFKSAQIYSRKLAATTVPRFYELYLNDAMHVERELDTLEAMTRANPRLNGVLSALRRDISAEMPTLLQYNIAEIVNRNEEWRLGKLYNIHANLAMFAHGEQALLHNHRASLDRALRTTRALSVALPLLAFFIIGLTFYSMLRETRRRRGLEQRLKEKITELEHSNSELEQYAYVASHDLQEPLRKIRIFAGQLNDAAGPRLEPKEKEYLSKIRTGSERMSGLIRDILNYSSLRDGERFVPTDLNEVVHNCLADLDLMVQQKKAVVTVEALCVVDAIPLQMHQLFFNLLNNALKYNRPDVPCEVQVKARVLDAEEAAGRRLGGHLEWCAITVTDNGLGFDNAHANQIFGLFKRLGHGSSGSGIGLALCRKVVENHGGRIEAQGAEGEGAVFHILLPLRQNHSHKTGI